MHCDMIRQRYRRRNLDSGSDSGLQAEPEPPIFARARRRRAPKFLVIFDFKLRNRWPICGSGEPFGRLRLRKWNSADLRLRLRKVTTLRIIPPSRARGRARLIPVTIDPSRSTGADRHSQRAPLRLVLRAVSARGGGVVCTKLKFRMSSNGHNRRCHGR